MPKRFNLSDTPSKYLERDKREIHAIKEDLEMYRRELGKFAGFHSQSAINVCHRLIMLLEEEIRTAKKYEEWLKD